MVEKNNMLTCKECGATHKDYLGEHLLQEHNLSEAAYKEKYPEAKTQSEQLKAAYKKSRTPRRKQPPATQDLTVTLAKIEFPVNVEVPAEACLKLPDNYILPKHGDLYDDIRHALVSIRKNRSLFVWGLPGSGKDALAHAYSALTRTPGLIFSIKPGVDIQSWFYTRAFDKEGTSWETGPFFNALVKGYEIKDNMGKVIKRIPYIIVVSDFDRADRAQAEYLRLILDSIEGRVEGPQGKTFKVLEGTLIMATGNSIGAGDHRGRMVSANVLDASILDRFNCVYEFHWMDWKDECKIVKAKFPKLHQRAEWVITAMGKCTSALRAAIHEEQLHAEFSHRALCSILQHAEDILDINGPKKKVPTSLLKGAIRVWLDRLSDPVTKEQALKLMDPHVSGGMLNHGDTSHLNAGVNW